MHRKVSAIKIVSQHLTQQEAALTPSRKASRTKFTGYISYIMVRARYTMATTQHAGVNFNYLLHSSTVSDPSAMPPFLLVTAAAGCG